MSEVMFADLTDIQAVPLRKLACKRVLPAGNDRPVAAVSLRLRFAFYLSWKFFNVKYLLIKQRNLAWL